MSARRHHGAALLAAMLTVALVATFAAAALWQQWRSIEVESAERSRVQSAWVLTGALDWARLLLREDARSGGPDHLGEPWAVPLQEARLSSFLAADRNNTAADVGTEVLEAFLSGQIIDLQSMLNVNSLVSNGTVSEADVAAFARLFELLSLPVAQLDLMVENLRFASDTSANNRSSPMAPLVPQRMEELVWLGVPVATVAALQPYVTVLPVRTPVNINTASAEVIFASVEGLTMADAQRLVSARESAAFKTLADARNIVNISDATAAQSLGNVAIASRFFEVRSRLRLEQLVVEERAVLQRDGLTISVLQRERGIADPTVLAQAATRR
ncbi:MAG TPA: type II secretion system minor pseudopilin GspK [Ramlibacter sp.]|nr:type II secretion system minor pseudopilin GspK [Ramlibacter sp.]